MWRNPIPVIVDCVYDLKSANWPKWEHTRSVIVAWLHLTISSECKIIKWRNASPLLLTVHSCSLLKGKIIKWRKPTSVVIDWLHAAICNYRNLAKWRNAWSVIADWQQSLMSNNRKFVKWRNASSVILDEFISKDCKFVKWRKPSSEIPDLQEMQGVQGGSNRWCGWGESRSNRLRTLAGLEFPPTNFPV